MVKIVGAWHIISVSGWLFTHWDNDIIVWDQNPTPGMTLTGCKIVMEVTLVECKNVKKNTAGSEALSHCSKLVSLLD